GDEQRLPSKEGVTQSPTCVSPDGRWVVFSEGQMRTQSAVWRVRLDGGPDTAPPEAITPSGDTVHDGQVSPDGRWLAYVSSVSGQLEVYLKPFRAPGPGPQAANGGGSAAARYARCPGPLL